MTSQTTSQTTSDMPSKHRQPVDKAERDFAITQTHTSIALSAGAGSGKTSVLTDRLVQHLLDGTPPKHVAAITFTNKAADELRERARDALEARFAAAKPSERPQLEEIFTHFGDLNISTIDSFCTQLLENEAFAAAWAPGTQKEESVGGASVSDTLYDEWRAAFDTRHPEIAVDLRQLVTEYNPHGGPTLKGIAKTLLDKRGLTPAMHADHGGVNWQGARDALREHLDAFESLNEHCITPDTCPFYSAATDLIESLAGALGQPDPEVAVRVVLLFSFPKLGRTGSAKDWPKKGITAARKSLKSLELCADEANQQLADSLHRIVLLDLQEYYVPQVFEARLQAAQASFSDVLFRSATLLKDHPSARERLHQRYQVILIDEVQDTDPVQARMATLLSRPPAVEGSWNVASPAPGHLFAVGDSKQSIYRFRGADVEIWNELKRLIGSEGKSLSLKQNFRSVPGIVNWVNAVFGEDESYTPQTPWRGPLEIDPIVLLESKSKDDEVEAALRYLFQLRADGVQIEDRATNKLRPLCWKDVMILLPSWQNSEVIQDGFSKAGVDCVIEGGKGFFSRDEVRLLVAAMQAIDEPQNTIAVIATLRGMFGVSHEQLAQHKEAGGAWRYTLPDQPSGVVERIFALLCRLHEERSQRSWVAILDELLDHTHAASVWALQRRGRSALANIDKLKVLIRSCEPISSSPSEVIELIQQHKDAGTEDLSVFDEDIDAVRITSIYKAKGLEAPVVMLLFMTRSIKTPAFIIDRETELLHLSGGKSFLPPDWDRVSKEERTALESERERMMYVAATRARDQLVIVRSEKARSSLYKHVLHRGMEQVLLPPPEDPTKKPKKKPKNPPKPKLAVIPHGELFSPLEGVQVRSLCADQLPAAPHNPATFPGIPQGLSQGLSLGSPPSSPLASNALDVHVDALLAGGPTEPDQVAKERKRRRGRAISKSKRASLKWKSVGQLSRSRYVRHDEEDEGIGAKAGTVVHQIMEQLDLGDADEALRARVPGLARAFGVLAELSEEKVSLCESVVMSLLDHEVVGQARTASERWREVPFTHQEGGRVIAGTIDLCFPTNESKTDWVIVDWKSHLPSVGSDLREQYEKQLKHYALALLKTVTPCKNIEATLVGPHSQLGEDNALAELLESVDEGLIALVGTLFAQEAQDPRGLVPDIGPDIDLGDGGEDIIPELAWESRKCLLALPSDLEPEERARALAAGWTLFEMDTTQATWPQVAEQQVLAHFGITSEA